MKKRTLFIRQNAIPLRFFLSYLVITAIAITSAWSSYWEAQRIITYNAQQFSLKTMASIRDLVDERLSKMDAVINRISSYYQTSMILNLSDPVGSGQMYQLKEYIQYLRNAAVHLSPETYITVYSRANGYVFAADFACLYPVFYKEVIRGQEDALQSQWLQTLQAAQSVTLFPTQVIYPSGAGKKVVPYVQSLPMGSQRSTGAICLYIDEQSLFSGLIDLSTSTLSYVMDSGGRVIASFSKAGALPPVRLSLPEEEGVFVETFNGEKTLVSYVHSDRGLTYISMTPQAIIMQQADHLNGIFLLTTVVCFSLCLLAATYFMRKNVSPVSKVYRMLTAHIGENGKTAPHLQYLEESVAQLLKDNSQLQDTMGQQNQEMRMAYFSHLITSGFESESELIDAAAYMGVDLGQAIYIVVALRILYPGDYTQKETIAGLHIVKASIRQALSLDASGITVVDTSANQMTLVFHFDEDALDYCRIFVHYIMADIKEMMDKLLLGFKAAAGAPRTQLADLYQAHQEALLTLDLIDVHTDMPLSWYEEEKRHGQIFYYPTDVEQRITASLRSGNNSELQGLYDKVIRENTEKLHISGLMGSLLLSEMRATLLRFVKEYPQENKEIQAHIIQSLLVLKSLSFSDAAKELRVLFIFVCDQTQQSRHNQGEDLKAHVLSYVNANASDPSMSLVMAAAYFNLSESYFSAFFKKHTGENFVSYLAKIRLEAACQLLQEDRYTIDQIAKKTGYSSAHSFRRAFKKQYGVNPASTRGK